MNEVRVALQRSIFAAHRGLDALHVGLGEFWGVERGVDHDELGWSDDEEEGREDPCRWVCSGRASERHSQKGPAAQLHYECPLWAAINIRLYCLRIRSSLCSSAFAAACFVPYSRIMADEEFTGASNSAFSANHSILSSECRI